jgi:C1A family cysteine protease
MFSMVVLNATGLTAHGQGSSAVRQEEGYASEAISPVALAAAAVKAQNQPVLGEDTVSVSEHVLAIIGWPNIACGQG